MATKASSKSKSSNVSKLSSQLSSVSKQAKSLGINTSKADAMVAQTKAEGSKSFKGSSYEKDYEAGKYGVITPEKLQTVPTPNIPTFTPTDPGNVVGAMNSSLASASNGLLTLDPKGQLSVTQNDPQQTTFQQMLDAQLGAYNEMGNSEDRMAKLEREAKLKQKREAVNSYTSQLNSIVAKSQADQLALEGQGRGVTDVIIGGQQAQINREAAIKALPIQAQLAAAQADLSMAQEHVDKMFQLQSQDALSKYQFKSKLIDSVFQYANAEQQRALEDKRIAESRAYDMQKMNMSTAQDFANQAFANGQSSLGARLMGLDPNSPTYREDVARLGAQLMKPSSGPAKRDTQVVDGKLIDMQTGEVISDFSGVAGGQDATNLDSKYTALLNDIGKAREMKDAVGKGSIYRGLANAFSGNNRPAQLDNITNTIKANLLTLNTDPAIKKFFGPQMSNRDTELMMGAAGTLDPVKQSPEEYDKDLQDAADLIVRAREAVRLGTQSSAPMSMLPKNVVYTPDGMAIEIID